MRIKFSGSFFLDLSPKTKEADIGSKKARKLLEQAWFRFCIEHYGPLDATFTVEVTKENKIQFKQRDRILSQLSLS